MVSNSTIQILKKTPTAYNGREGIYKFEKRWEPQQAVQMCIKLLKTMVQDATQLITGIPNVEPTTVAIPPPRE